jgi:hypothetical protein
MLFCTSCDHLVLEREELTPAGVTRSTSQEFVFGRWLGVIVAQLIQVQLISNRY